MAYVLYLCKYLKMISDVIVFPYVSASQIVVDLRGSGETWSHQVMKYMKQTVKQVICGLKQSFM